MLHHAIPPYFCWTKIGTEAGEPLAAILRRKEFERRANGRIFTWGIGTSIEKAAAVAKIKSGGDSLDVLFTKMLSSPKPFDVSPSSTLLWLSYIAAPSHSLAPLPPFSLVTSRGPAKTDEPLKKAHYALLCAADRDLTVGADGQALDSALLRNVQSLRPVGASQVTAVVHHDASFRRAQAAAAVPARSSPYEIAFSAKLAGQGFVKLARPVLLSKDLLTLCAAACASTTVDEWRARVALLKHRAAAAERLGGR